MAEYLFIESKRLFALEPGCDRFLPHYLGEGPEVPGRAHIQRTAFLGYTTLHPWLMGFILLEILTSYLFVRRER
jgi:hypothetical protein